MRPGHWRLLLDNEDLFSTGLQEVGAIRDMLALVASNPRAIGYEVLWNPHRYQKQVKALHIGSYSPTEPGHLMANAYPLYRTYNLTTWDTETLANPMAQKLVDYLVQEAEHLDPKYGIVAASHLRKAGWEFLGDELIGEPH